MVYTIVYLCKKNLSWFDKTETEQSPQEAATVEAALGNALQKSNV